MAVEGPARDTSYSVAKVEVKSSGASANPCENSPDCGLRPYRETEIYYVPPRKKQIVIYAARGVIWTAWPRFCKREMTRRILSTVGVDGARRHRLCQNEVVADLR